MTKLAERKAWLAGLKPGDEIAVSSSDDEQAMQFVHVERVASRGYDGSIHWCPDRRTAAPSHVKANGRITTQYGKRLIQPVTDEIRQIVADRDALNRLLATPWGIVPVEVRRKVVALLDEAGVRDGR